MMLTKNLVIVVVVTAIAILLSAVKSIFALVFVPALIAIGAQFTSGARIEKFMYLVVSFLILTVWLVAKEASSPIEPPGLLALLGIWLVISAVIFMAISVGGHSSNRK